MRRISQRVMSSKLRVCLFLIVLFGSPIRTAESGDAELFRRCASVPATAAAADAVCVNYVYGVLNLLPLGQSEALRRNTCFPIVLSPSQAGAIVDNYARNHPERLHAGAATMRAEAFYFA